MKGKDIILIIVSVLLVGVSALFCLYAKKKPLESIKYVDRVITLYDTIEVLKPYEIVKERKIAVHDTMFIPMRDTIRQRDTLFMPVQREYRTYGDDRYNAVVSGYKPRLESLNIYQKREIVEVKEKKRWGIGLQVGYGVYLDGVHLNTCPYIGIGISYNLIRF